MELYDLDSDVGETRNVAAAHPKVVARMAEIMKEATTPNPRYQVGTVYRGKPIWRKN